MQIVQFKTADGKEWDVNPVMVKNACYEESGSVELVFRSERIMNVVGSWDEVRNKLWP